MPPPVWRRMSSIGIQRGPPHPLLSNSAHPRTTKRPSQRDSQAFRSPTIRHRAVHLQVLGCSPRRRSSLQHDESFHPLPSESPSVDSFKASSDGLVSKRAPSKGSAPAPGTRGARAINDRSAIGGCVMRRYRWPGTRIDGPVCFSATGHGSDGGRSWSAANWILDSRRSSRLGR